MSWDFFLAAGAGDLPVEGIRKGTIAQWRGSTATDFGPAIDPLNNLGDVRFHSDFDYLRIVRKVTSRDDGMAPVNVPAVGINDDMDEVYPLFTHGLSPAPLLIAVSEIGGYKQALAGSGRPLPAGNPDNANWRVLEILASATTVALRARGGWAPQMDVHWEVYLLAEAFQVRSEMEEMWRFEPDAMDGAIVGKVSAAHRFLHKLPSGTGAFAFTGGLETSVTSLDLIEVSDGRTDWGIRGSAFEAWGGVQYASTYSVAGVELDL